VSNRTAVLRSERRPPTEAQHQALAQRTRFAAHPRKLYFFHIPKTGGRTVERHLVGRFGELNVWRPERRKRWFTDLFMKSKSSSHTVPEHAHIAGHYAPWSLLRGRERSYYKACFWRDPSDWWLSLYNYRHFRNAHRMKRRFSFADFQRSMLRNPMTEHLLLFCAGVPGWSYFFMSDRAKFKMAYALIKKFDQFADISKVDQFIDAVGFHDGQESKVHNRIPAGQKMLRRLDPPTRRLIEQTNSVDFYLHQLALKHDEQVVCDEASRMLSASFDTADLLRLAVIPYFRFATWVVPFLPTWETLLGLKRTKEAAAARQ